MSDWQRDAGRDDFNRSGDEVPAPPPGPGGDTGFGYGPMPAPAGMGGTAAGGPAPEALAGFWIRFAGALLDGILVGIVVSVLSAILGTGADGQSALQFLLGGAYFTYFHASAAGQSVGNRVVGVRVLSLDDGTSLSYGRALIRFLMSYVSAIALLIGYLWMLFDGKNQTWHDKVAGSVVVKTSHYPTNAGLGQPAS